MPAVVAAARAGHSGAERAGVSALAVTFQGPVGVILTHPTRVVAKIARHVSGLGAELKVVEDGAAFLRFELSFHVTNPTHSQDSNTIYDFANLFSGVFWQIHRGVPVVCESRQGRRCKRGKARWRLKRARFGNLCGQTRGGSVSATICAAKGLVSTAPAVQEESDVLRSANCRATNFRENQKREEVADSYKQIETTCEEVAPRSALTATQVSEAAQHRPFSTLRRR
jgi:hypothetical protein